MTQIKQISTDFALVVLKQNKPHHLHSSHAAALRKAMHWIYWNECNVDNPVGAYPCGRPKAQFGVDPNQEKPLR